LRERVRTAAGPAEVFSALEEFLAGGLRRFPSGAGRDDADGEPEESAM
jgi:hypothetical protein